MVKTWHVEPFFSPIHIILWFKKLSLEVRQVEPVKELGPIGTDSRSDF